MRRAFVPSYSTPTEEWEDLNEKLVPCVDNYTDPRRLQNRFFIGQKRDFDAQTGNRGKAVSLGRPGIDVSPETTLWWDNVNDVPGAEKGVNASGYDTMYDRLRVSSAMSIVEIPVYNYATNVQRSKHDLGTFIAFQADGIVSNLDLERRRKVYLCNLTSVHPLLGYQFTGYSGCNHKTIAYATCQAGTDQVQFSRRGFLHRI